jgi:signal transduction histidine kinase
VVFAEPADDGGVFCSVTDDGRGFDPTAVTEGVGVTQSIRARVQDIGGRAEIRSQPGRGTEVCLWVR